MTDFQPIQLIPPVAHAAPDAEDTARADLYGLLATLLYRAPDAALLHHIAANRAHGEDAATPLGHAWNDLCDAASVTTAEQASDEYQQLFVGVGKPEVLLYGSYYQTGFLNERPLVALRDGGASRVYSLQRCLIGLSLPVLRAGCVHRCSTKRMAGSGPQMPGCSASTTHFLL